MLASWHPIFTRFSTSHIWPHPSLKKRIHLFKPIDMKLNFAFLFVLHAEVKPLAMAVRIGVDSHV